MNFKLSLNKKAEQERIKAPLITRAELKKDAFGYIDIYQKELGRSRRCYWNRGM
ncbi:hypothetical protein VRK_13390 [Vibrio sp. MEBiC08052]|nr:hypothetical protein VRK_13390 [Vibrio sp. MEBiC08052]